MFISKANFTKSDPYALLKNLDGLHGIGYVVRTVLSCKIHDSLSQHYIEKSSSLLVMNEDVGGVGRGVFRIGYN